jgi:hypothetical protein|tara:strand:+ start:3723 stop:3875 length:153 start_codon:yes stop_codon:yes gene_type:complete
MKKYTILITPINKTEKPYTTLIESDRLDWSMEQYQRNRDAFVWEIKEVNE